MQIFLVSPAGKSTGSIGGVNPPNKSDAALFVTADYISAIGGEGRDYATLVEASRRMPNYRFVIIAREKSLLNLVVPDNVTSYTNLALSKTMNVLQNAKIAVVP